MASNRSMGRTITGLVHLFLLAHSSVHAFLPFHGSSLPLPVRAHNPQCFDLLKSSLHRGSKKRQSIQLSLVDPGLADLSLSSHTVSNLAENISPAWTVPLRNSLLAGLSTSLGGSVAFLPKSEKSEQRIGDLSLAFALALAASVMVTVSVVSVFPESFGSVEPFSPTFWERLLSVGLGCAMYAGIENILPQPDEVVNDKYSNDNSSRHDQNAWSSFLQGSDLTSEERVQEWRLTILLFVTLLLHNFPEGIAVAASSVKSDDLGITTALAIGLHNIPEGIAISTPCLSARPGAPWFAFFLATLSGLAEPLGASIVLLVLGHPASAANGGVLDINNALAFVGGIMTTVAICELLPEAIHHARRKAQGRIALAGGLICGAGVMLLTEMVLE